jgi:hypothetical protein
MITSGGSFLFKKTRYVIGAVLLIRGMYYLAVASHIFQKADTGVHVQVESSDGIVKRFLEDFDIALIELPPGITTEITEFGRGAELEEATLVNERHRIPCRIIRAGASLLYLQFRCSDMPQSGDSGSPIFQKGKVVGLLSSIMLSNCTGTAVSSDVLHALSI